MYFSYGVAFYLFMDKILTNSKRVLFIVNLGNILVLRVRQYDWVCGLSDVKPIPFLVLTGVFSCDDGV